MPPPTPRAASSRARCGLRRFSRHLRPRRAARLERPSFDAAHRAALSSASSRCQKSRLGKLGMRNAQVGVVRRSVLRSGRCRDRACADPSARRARDPRALDGLERDSSSRGASVVSSATIWLRYGPWATRPERRGLFDRRFGDDACSREVRQARRARATSSACRSPRFEPSAMYATSRIGRAPTTTTSAYASGPPSATCGFRTATRAERHRGRCAERVVARRDRRPPRDSRCARAEHRRDRVVECAIVDALPVADSTSTRRSTSIGCGVVALVRQDADERVKAHRLRA